MHIVMSPSCADATWDFDGESASAPAPVGRRHRPAAVGALCGARGVDGRGVRHRAPAVPKHRGGHGVHVADRHVVYWAHPRAATQDERGPILTWKAINVCRPSVSSWRSRHHLLHTAISWSLEPLVTQYCLTLAVATQVQAEHTRGWSLWSIKGEASHIHMATFGWRHLSLLSSTIIDILPRTASRGSILVIW